MKILLFIGFKRGLMLLRRLLSRNESVTRVYVYPEDDHESEKFSCAIERLCVDAGIEVRVCRKVSQQELKQASNLSDVAFCLGWRSIIDVKSLADLSFGAFGVHDSLLPKMRGFAPTSWALLNGLREHGATLFRLQEGVDDGEVFGQSRFFLTNHSTLCDVSNEVAHHSLDLICSFLDNPTKPGWLQDNAETTYCCPRIPIDGFINWRDTTVEIERTVRSLGPPGPLARSSFEGELLEIIDASIPSENKVFDGRVPGRVVGRYVDTGEVDVLTGDGILRIKSVRVQGNVVKATAVIRSIRSTLGLNPEAELLSLRKQVVELSTAIEKIRKQLEGKPQTRREWPK